MTERDYFLDRLKTTLGPGLREHGFQGSMPTFRRARDEFIHVVNIQRSDTGTRCYVNLGVHLLFLPDVLGRSPDPKRLREPECEFRTRLDDENGLGHWLYGEGSSEADANASALVSAMLGRGLDHFDRYRYPKELIEAVSPEDLGGPHRARLHLTVVRGALALARIAVHVGDREKAKAYAAIGLAECEARGLPFRGKFREILEAS